MATTGTANQLPAQAAPPLPPVAVLAAAPSAAEKAAADQARPAIATGGRTAPTDWDAYDFGPYEKFPTQQQMVYDGYLMQRYDPTVGSALKVLKMLVGSHLGAYHHDDESIQEFIRNDFEYLRGGLRRTVNALLSCLWAGYAVAEKRWETESSAWHIAGLDLLHPMTFFPRRGGQGACGIAIDPKVGVVTEVVQQPQAIGEGPIVFQLEQVVYWPFLQELREEVLGKRLTDTARRSWFMRVKLESFWGVFLERFAHPTPVATVPKGQQEDSSGNIVQNATFYAQFLSNLAPGRCLAVELSEEEKAIWSLENALGSTDSGDMSYRRACDYYNAELWKSVLMSPLLLEEPAHGSRAQASTVLELTTLLVRAIQDELGATLVDQVAKPLITYNFGAGVEDFGAWEFDPLQNEDLEFLSGVAERVVRAGAIVPTEADEASFREKYAEAGFVAAEEVTPEASAAAREKQLQLPVGYGV